MPRKGYKQTKEHTGKIRKVLMGNTRRLNKKHPHSETTKKKISLSEKGKFVSIETRKKMSKSHKGAKCHWWKGGISFEPYSTDWTDDLRDSIRKRDNYTCQICGIHQDELKGYQRKLDCHHIDYDKDNLNPDNLITLCRKCHIKTNTNREYWIKYFLIK